MFLTSFLTLGATVCALIYLKGTLDETKKMTVDTRRMADEAAMATKAALDAAEAGREANGIALDANKQQLRAWISLDGVKPILNNVGSPSAPRFADDFAAVEPIFINTGQSPALKVRTHCDDRWVPNLNEGVPHFDGLARGRDDVPYTGSYVGRDRPLIAPRKSLEGENARRWLRGEGYWIVYVKIEYEDIFGGEHLTELCLLIQLMQHIVTPRGLEPQFAGRPFGEQNRMT